MHSLIDLAALSVHSTPSPTPWEMRGGTAHMCSTTQLCFCAFTASAKFSRSPSFLGSERALTRFQKSQYESLRLLTLSLVHARNRRDRLEYALNSEASSRLQALLFTQKVAPLSHLRSKCQPRCCPRRIPKTGHEPVQ